ncbi:hypothetical protein [Algoriphagus lacus]|nr:hypothetical protein [Algoriphagus lacus]
MARMVFIFLLFGLAVSCSTIPDPIPESPEQLETDSLMAIYGKSIVTPNLNFLKYFQLDKNGNTLVYGGTSDRFWFGAFRPDRSLIKENLVQLDLEKRFEQPVSKSSAISQRVLDKLIFEVFTHEQSEKSPNTSLARSIMGLSESTYEINYITDYIHRDDYIYIELARPWKGGYLLEINGSLGRSGKNYTQYISTDFSVSQKWDCRSPLSPRIGVYYFEKDLFVDVVQNGVWGFNYSTCSRWEYNTLDFFGKETCPGCNTSIKLKSQQEGICTLEVSLNGEIRTVVIDYRTGALVSNG